MKRKWDKLSKEEIVEIFNKSTSYKNLQELFGYRYDWKRNKEIEELAKKLDISLEKFKIKKNQIGDTFNFLTVLEKLPPDTDRNLRSLCQCRCGNQIITTDSKLRQGKVKSCGCYVHSQENRNKQRENLRDKTFGYLKPLKVNEIKTRESGYVYWDCVCLNCSNKITVSRKNLIKGQISCGCIKSKGTKAIIDLLNKNNIPFKTEISFNDLVGIGNKKLRFDIGIYKNEKIEKLIEFNGIQHYSPVEFFGGEEALIKQKYHDELKKEYCNKNNISLIIFSEINQISLESIMGGDY